MSAFGNGPYFCKHHPEREVVAPIALRQCQQCHDDALERYADYNPLREEAIRDSRTDYQLTPWGESVYARIKGAKDNEL